MARERILSATGPPDEDRDLRPQRFAEMVGQRVSPELRQAHNLYLGVAAEHGQSLPGIAPGAGFPGLNRSDVVGGGDRGQRLA